MKKVLGVLGMALLGLMSSAFAMSPELSICEQMPYSSDRLACMQTVRGNTFDPGALQICGAMPYSSDKLACLKQIANTPYDRDATRLCAQLPYTSDQRACLSKTAWHSYQPEAVSACSELPYSSDRMLCVDIIADKWFRRDELDLCRTLPYSSDKLSCIRAIALISQPQPPLPVPPTPPTPPAAQDPSCREVYNELMNSCPDSQYLLSKIARRADHCETAASGTGQTRLHLFFANSGGNQLTVVPSRGEARCQPRTIAMLNVGPLAQIEVVHSFDRSDKIFARSIEGSLLTLDLRFHAFEILNSKGLSYRLTRIRAAGPEKLTLTHDAGNQSTLTFEQIEARRRDGKLIEIPVQTNWLN